MDVKAGNKYYCYKGGEYEVVCCAKHSETDEELVVYRALDGSGEIWAESLGMFDNTIPCGCGRLRRFEPIY